MRSGFAALLTAAMLIGGLPLTPPAASTPEDPPVWWGPTDETGWHFRVPVTVTNDRGHTLADGVARAELDLPALLAQAGWPATGPADQRQLQAFQLEFDSPRVIEYTSLDPPSSGAGEGQAVGMVPSLIKAGWLERAHSAPYNNATNPQITVTWLLEGETEPGQERSFYIYLDATFHPDKRPDRSRSPVLSNQHYVGAVTRAYGFAERLWFVGMEDDTTVTLLRYPNPTTVVEADPPRGTDQTNPFTIGEGDTVEFALGVSNPVPVLVSADKPVLVTGGGRGLVPGTQGLLTGRSFSIPVPASTYADGPVPPGGFGVFPAGPFASVQVTSRSPDSRCVASGSYTLSPASPAIWPVCGPATIDVQSGSPLVVQSQAPGGLVQLPDRTGAALGQSLGGLAWTFEPAGQQGGGDSDSSQREQGTGGDSGATQGEAEPGRFVTVAPLRSAATRVSVQTTDEQVFPRTEGGDASFERLEPGASEGIGNGPNIERFPRNLFDQESPSPLRFQVDDEATPKGEIMAWAGSLDNAAFASASLSHAPASEPSRVVSPFAGVNATQFFGVQRERGLEDTVSVFAFYDDTEILVDEPEAGSPTRVTLSRHEHRELPVSGAWELESSKPVAVLPYMATGFFPGVRASPEVRVGNASFYGPLVSLAPALGDTEPMLRSVGPGGEVTYELNVTNLARTATGNPLQDTVQLSVDGLPTGWSATLNRSELALDGGQRALVGLAVQPPEDAEIGSRATFRVAARSSSNPGIEDTVTIMTLLKTHYELGLWYERVEGPSTRTFPMEPGATRTVPIVLKSLGNAPDQVALNVTGADAGGWASEITLDGGSVDIVPIGAGEVKTLTLNLSAPDSASASLTTFEVGVTSLNSAAAVAKVLGTAKIRTVADLRVDLANETRFTVPDEVARYPITLTNEGNQAINVVLNVSGAPLPGWPRPDLTLQGVSVRELSNLVPGQPVTVHLVVPVPASAPAFLKAPVSVRVEAVSSDGASLGSGQGVLATTVVEPIRDLTVQPPRDRIELAHGRTHEVSLPVVNKGNADAFVSLHPTSWPPGWRVAPTRAIDVPANTTGTAQLSIQVPPHAPHGNRTVTFEVRSAGEVRAVIDLDVRVPVDPTLSVTATEDLQKLPVGASTVVDVLVENLGNVDRVVSISVESPDVPVELLAGTLDLAPGDRAPVPVRVDLANVDTPGAWNVTVLAHETGSTPGLNASSEHVLEVHATAPNLRLQRAVPRTQLEQVSREDLFTVSALVVNEGPITVRGVEVELRIDGEPVDRVRIERLQVDEPARASLAWRVDHTPSSAEVVVNPDRTLAEPTYEDNAIRIEGSQPQALPTLGPLVLSALLGLVAAARRKSSRTRDGTEADPHTGEPTGTLPCEHM